MTVDPTLLSHLLQALVFGSARLFGLAVIIPIFAGQFIGATSRNCICLGLSLPQIWLLWHAPATIPSGPMAMGLLAGREVAVGVLLGILLSMPFWAVSGVGTLIDNQRGANAAQMANPSLQADASVLGELCMRSLIALMAELGLLLLVCDVVWRSYSLLPIDSTAISNIRFSQAAPAMVQMIGDILRYTAPILVLLLLVELAMAICSSFVDGMEVYQTAMPVKSLTGLFMLLLYFPALLKKLSGSIQATWVHDLMESVLR